MNNEILILALLISEYIVVINEIRKKMSRHESMKEDKNYFPTLPSINVGKRSISVGLLLSKLISYVLYVVLLIVTGYVMARLSQEHVLFNDTNDSINKCMEVEREWIRQHLQ
jgi:hypothetical protein